MQDLDERSVTQTALAQMAGTPDPRLREIMAAAVRHLHDFAREVNLTPGEWLQAIAFLTEVGQACTPARQEFILLSDVLGLSALVNLMHNRTAPEAATQTSLLGPFFREDAPVLAAGAAIFTGSNGKEIVVHGQVRDIAGNPVPHATLDVWQANPHGEYDLQYAGPPQVDMRARFTTDADGRYHFRTMQPPGYPVPMDGPAGRLVRLQGRHGMRPAHIHVMIAAEGFRELVTALYFADDPHIESDTVFGVSRALLVRAGPDPAAPCDLPAVRYDFTLSRASSAGSTRVGADPARIVKVAE
ncbi:MAG: hydroxyquinol 1,2-dioxygenase [Rhodospirillales bacterium]|nr:hydroxyquinol 1,2-dioxygenase [Rhodospirillales bacterium]